MMNASKVKFSGSKITPQSDFRVGVAQEASSNMKQRSKNFIKDKYTRRIGTWNVNTLLQAGKLENLKIEMRKHKMDILGISEMRWQGTGDFWSDEYRIIYSGTEEGRGGMKGVGIVLEKSLGLRVTGYVQYSDRIMLVKINTKPNDTVILQIYMPTTNEDDEEIERIYEEVDKLLERTRADDNVIVLGDMNATVGEGREGAVVGKYGHGRRNERGERLIEFCIKNKLVIANTLYNQHKRRRYTWKAPGDMRRLQLDYIMVKERFKNQIKNCKCYPGADIGSDHNLVMMKCNLKYKKLNRTQAKGFELIKLKTQAIREEYEQKTDEIAEQIQDVYSRNIEAQWEMMKEGMLGTAEELLKQENKRKRKAWISEEVIELISKRRKYKNATREEDKRQYRRLRNEIVRKSRRDKDIYLNGICEEIDNELKVGNLDKGYGMVKQFFGEKKNKTSGLKDGSGRYLFEEKEITELWKQYLQRLYADEDMDEEALENEDDVEEDERGEYILKDEFYKAIEDIKRKKAPGIDGIPAELIKGCGVKAKTTLYKIICRIYETGIIPSDFTKSIIVPIPKKARAQTCDQYRTLSLTSHVSKILTRIILRRIEKNIDNFLTEDQFGFRKDMGTRDTILALRQVIEKRNRKGQTTYIAFVDLEKAFDNVNWNKMFGMLRKIGIRFRDRRIIHNLYKDEVGVIRFGENQEEAKIKKGVRQGCSLSPHLFNLYVQEAINRIRENISVGVEIHGEKVDMLRFADDIAIITCNRNDLLNMLNTMNQTMRNEFNMKINIQKTKVLVCSRKGEQGQNIPPIYLDNIPLEQVTEYKYLGSLITKEGTSKREINSRIAQAKCAFSQKKNLLTSRNVNLKTRSRLLKTYVWSVALYGSETWTIGKAEERRLLAFEAWCWRRVLKISWVDHVTNDEVFRRAGEKRSLINSIKMRRAGLMGHVLRHDSLLKRIIEGMTEGINTRGRPPLAYMDQIRKDFNASSYYELKRKTEDRLEWRVATNQL